VVADQLLEINLDYIFGDETLPYSLEQLIAHEMVHATKYRDITIGNTPEGDTSQTWYNESAAEWSARADAELLGRYGPTIEGGEANTIFDGVLATWGDGADEYMEAYLAHRYIEWVYGAEKVTQIADHFENNADAEAAIQQVLGYADMDAFEAAAEAWARQVYLKVDTGQPGEHSKIDLNGLGYTRKNPRPLWGDTFDIHIGPGPWETIEVKTPDARAGALDFLAFANVLRHIKAEDTILTSGKAIDLLTTARSDIGAKMVRLEGILEALQEQEEKQMAAKSRIEDLDFAKEAMNLTRNQILTQSSLAMLTQANAAPQNVLALI
jgi:flagellin-like hook-associated protein FlgL